MNNSPTSLLKKTDAELVAMIRELAVQIDTIGREQTRRLLLDRRQTIAAQNVEENEGGITQVEPS